MAFNSSGKLVVGAYDRSYATDETTGFSDISVLTSANLKSFNNSQRVTTASMGRRVAPIILAEAVRALAQLP